MGNKKVLLNFKAVANPKFNNTLELLLLILKHYYIGLFDNGLIFFIVCSI